MNVEVGPDDARRCDVARGRAGPARAGLQPLDGQDVVANVLGTAVAAPAGHGPGVQHVRRPGRAHRAVHRADGRRTPTAGVAYENGQTAGAGVRGRRHGRHHLRPDPGGRAGHRARRPQDIGYPVAGKTGTSSDNKSAWFIGYTRQLTTAVAMYQVGTDDAGKPIAEPITPFGGYSQITGGSVPARPVDRLHDAGDGRPRGRRVPGAGRHRRAEHARR